jgi:hypothetical protein
MKHTTLFLILSFFTSLGAIAQTLTQTVRGRVIDQDGKFPLIGVNIQIQGSHPVIGTVTDENGLFHLLKVPVGRITVICSYLGYESKTISNLIIETGKETVLTVELAESVVKVSEVVISGPHKKGEALNEMALLSARSFSVEETKRYAGSMSDPSRMVSAYAGVSSNPEGNNDIVVRGNSPKGILWRLEGVEIPNPNHFSDESTTGGPINVLNSNMLANSDFYTGAFAPEYGNVLSGVFDMKLRTGNNEKTEYAVGLGALGMDITAEGPFKQGYDGSFLVNYRYSSLALLNNLGLTSYDGIPKYQDVSFKVSLPTQCKGTLSLFGLGGISHINIEEPGIDENDIVENVDYTSKMGVIGLNHLCQPTPNTFIKTSVSISGNGSSFDQKSREINAPFFYDDARGNISKSTLNASATFSHKLSASDRIVAGATYSHFFYALKNSYFDEKIDKRVSGLNSNSNAGLIQGYANWKHRTANNITFVSGIHYMQSLINNNVAVEPRIAIKWDINSRNVINAGFGLHSKMESIVTYNAVIHDDNGIETTPNKKLDFSKARHFVLGYENRLMPDLTLKTEFYYQDLYNIPVENNATSTFSLLNEDDGFVDKPLVNKGTGKNYGVDITLEKYFTKSYYFMLTSSLYQSKYKTLENKERNTRYNGKYSFNFLVGKEFAIGKASKGHLLNLNTRLFYGGGQRYIPLDLAASQKDHESVYQRDKAGINKLDDVFQMNFAANYRINRPHASHEIVIDIMNITNNQARVSEYYNQYTNKKEYSRQLKMLPNIMYRIYF